MHSSRILAMTDSVARVAICRCEWRNCTAPASQRCVFGEFPSGSQFFGFSPVVGLGERQNDGGGTVLRASSMAWGSPLLSSLGGVWKRATVSAFREGEICGPGSRLETRKIFFRENEKSGRTLIARAGMRDDYGNVQKPDTTVPLWLWILLFIPRYLKEASEFLLEQPRELQYIEWPSFQSTSKMALLTVVVVTFLIIFLSTIDSTFSYVLASILRRVP